MALTRRATRIAVVASAAVAVVGLAWLGSGRLSGRATGYPPGDCTITTQKGDDGVPEAFARCAWPLPADRIDAVLRLLDEQERHFSGVADSTVLRVDGERTLVRQVQQASGISDREVVLEFVVETIPNGRRYRWRKADDQSGRNPDNVECEVHEGHWQIAGAGNETIVEYHLRYLPGGSVPTFMVTAFLGSGVEEALDDLRDAAATQQVASRDGAE